MKRPNLLRILTDQQRWDALGAAGNPHIRTPNLDRLAGQSCLFENAITPNPVCVPARASAMTGYAPSGHGILAYSEVKCVKDPRDTLATHLERGGYHCQGIGKMHFSPHGETLGMHDLVLSEETRGFRRAKSVESVRFDDYDRFLIERGLWGWEKPPEIGYNEIKPTINGLPKEAHVTQWCGDRTIDWLRNARPADRPFFLFSSFVKPHSPFDCPSHLIDLYDPDEMPDPIHSERDGTADNPFYAESRRTGEWDLYSEQAQKRAAAYYYANITFIDEQVGRILDTLEAEGLADDTLVLFTSDHGEMLGDHGQWFKTIGLEGSLRVPMLLRWPGRVEAGTRCGEVTSLLDIFPTFCSAAGQAFDAEFRPGKDLVAFANGEAPAALLHARHKHWKYLWYQNGGYEELYDLENDPRETVNLAKDSAYAGRLAELREATVAWVRRYGDPAGRIDGAGELIAHPYTGADLKAALRRRNPYARMPWDCRVPPATLPWDERSFWWQAHGPDWAAGSGVTPPTGE